jgi:transcriptional regulator with XRE-family HTH domain
MRQSPCRHPLAVLRLFLELGQKEMADLIGCAASTVQAIELKQLRLTEELAQRVVKATGVNFGWLMAGNPKARILNSVGWVYSKYNYETAQGKLGREMDPEWQKKSKEYAELFAGHYRDRLEDILFAAMKKDQYQWAWWKVDTLLEELEKEFKIPFKDIPFVLPPEGEKPASPAPSRTTRPSTKKPKKKK